MSFFKKKGEKEKVETTASHVSVKIEPVVGIDPTPVLQFIADADSVTATDGFGRPGRAFPSDKVQPL